MFQYMAAFVSHAPAVGLQTAARSSGRCPRRVPIPRASVACNDQDGGVDPIREVAQTITKFMNEEKRYDVLQYALRFGSKVQGDQQEDVQSWRLLDVGRSGVQIEIMLCEKEDERCICVEETVHWIDGKIASTVDEVTHQLSKLSASCGLSGEL